VHPLRSSAKVSVLLAAIVATMTLVGALPAAEPTLHLAGVVRLGIAVRPSDRLAIDPSRHRGYYFSTVSRPTLTVIDLVHLRVSARKALSVPDGPFAVDPIRHRVFIAAPAIAGRCDSAAVWILDGISLTTKRVQLPCDPASGPIVMDALSIDAPRSVLSVIGRRGSITVFRQMSVRDDQILLDWETTQRGLCDADAVVVRMKHGTAAHCASGSGGRAIWIPTWHGVPVVDAVGHAILRVTETAGRATASAVDKQTGRVAVATSDDDVAVYDAPYERRVVTMSPPAGRVRRGGTARSAFDPESGRLYLLRDGLVEAADVRGASPVRRFELPARITHGARIAVDSRSHRIFIPSRDGLIALQDDRPPVRPAEDGNDRRARSGTREVQPRAGSETDLIVVVVSSATQRPTLHLRLARAIERLSGLVAPPASHRFAVKATLLRSATANAVIVRRCRLCEPLRAPPSRA